MLLVAGVQVVGYRTQAEAEQRARDQADTVDAIVSFKNLGLGSGGLGYTLRVNHTEVPSTRSRFNTIDLQPDVQYKKYWMYANVQHHLDR